MPNAVGFQDYGNPDAEKRRRALGTGAPADATAAPLGAQPNPDRGADWRPDRFRGTGPGSGLLEPLHEEADEFAPQQSQYYAQQHSPGSTAMALQVAIQQALTGGPPQIPQQPSPLNRHQLLALGMPPVEADLKGS